MTDAPNSPTKFTPEQKAFWAFQPVADPPVPKVNDARAYQEEETDRDRPEDGPERASRTTKSSRSTSFARTCTRIASRSDPVIVRCLIVSNPNHSRLGPRSSVAQRRALRPMCE